MAMNLEREIQAYLVDLCGRGLVDDRGRICKDLFVRENGRKVLPPMGGFLGPAAAYLALTPFQGNPYHGSDALLDLAFEAGERLVIDHAGITRDTKPNHFTIYPLGYLYELLADRAGKPQLARWRRTMAANLQAVDALIDRTWQTLGKPGPWSGTGPNHFFGWFAVGYHQAQLLGEKTLGRKIEKALLRHLRLQTRGGYFPEHIGPAVGYQHVSLAGLAEFHRQDPLPQTRRSVEHGADFMVRATYPDLRGIETFDERNRLGKGSGFQSGLFWTPQGRTLIARWIAQARQHPRTDDIFGFRNWGPWGIGGAYRGLLHAQATRGMRMASQLPADRERFTWRLEDKGLVRKQGPWFYAMSAWAHDAEHGNPYHLERTQALSIYHGKAGLIVGGGNDKHAYRNATIHILEGGDCHYFPALASKLRTNVAPEVLSGQDTCDRIEFDYGSARANLEVRAESAGRLRIGLGVWTSQTGSQIWLVLQLPAKQGVTLASAGRKLALKPAQEGQAAKEYPLARNLASSTSWRMSLPSGSVLLWPHLPWNPYRPPTYRETPDMAVALVRVPLHQHDWHVEVVLSAG